MRKDGANWLPTKRRKGPRPNRPKELEESSSQKISSRRRVHGYLLRDNERDRNARSYSGLRPHGGDPGPPHRRHSSHALYHQGAQVRNAFDPLNARRNPHVPDGHGVLLNRNGLHLRLAAELILKSGNWASSKKSVIAYAVQSMWVVGNFIPMFAIRDAYFAPYLSKFGEEYVSILMSLIPPWTLPLFFVVSFVSGAHRRPDRPQALSQALQESGIA